MGDLELNGAGVAQSTDRLLKATRIIVNCLSDPSKRVTVEDIARETGISEPWVRYILRSAECRDLLADACERRINRALLIGIGEVTDIMQDKTQPAEVRRKCLETLFKGRKVLAEGLDRQDESAAEQQLLAAMESIKRAKCEVVVEDAGP